MQHDKVQLPQMSICFCISRTLNHVDDLTQRVDRECAKKNGENQDESAARLSESLSASPWLGQCLRDARQRYGHAEREIVAILSRRARRKKRLTSWIVKVCPL